MKLEKEHKIIMLPSQTDSPIALESSGLLKFIGTMDEAYFNQDNQQGQHLYILSDEDIKKGDWFINLGSGGHPEVAIYRANSENSKAINEFKYPEIKKIIATTDAKLHYNKIVEEDMHMYKESLPHIPQHIIEAYVKKPFDKVLVEYNELRFPLKERMGIMDRETIPKLNTDGTLVVSLVEEDIEQKMLAHFSGKRGSFLNKKLIHEIVEWVKGTDLGNECNYIVPDKPELNQDGTLGLTLVEEKMYSREEVEDMFRNAIGEIHSPDYDDTFENLSIWIKENL